MELTDAWAGILVPDPNKLPDPAGLAKVILQTVRDQRGELQAVLAARHDTGQIIGSVQGQAVRFGCGTGMREYFFLDDTRGLGFLKDLCRAYLGRKDLDFLSEEGGKLIQMGQPGPSRIRQM